jgi:hypothetical protein
MDLARFWHEDGRSCFADWKKVSGTNYFISLVAEIPHFVRNNSFYIYEGEVGGVAASLS